jgi:hypothetical protein
MTDIFGSKPRLVVEAIVIRACSHCGAPGIDENQNPVGSRCPKCFAPRPADENKGVIYDTRWFFGWGKFKRKFQKFLGRK